MTKSPWHIAPNPLDYVPVERLQAPSLAHKPTTYTVNPLRRGATAVGWMLAVVAAVFIFAVTVGAI